MDTIKKILLLIVGCLCVATATAQTGIGTTTPEASAKLDVSSTNKGFLPPRIALTAMNSASPVTSPATGLLIFNTASAGTIPNQVTPGYYYWDGVNSKWVRLVDKEDNLGNHTATDNIRLNGNYLSNDGGSEGIKVDNSGNVGIGTDTPTSRLNIAGGGVRLATGFSNATNRPSLTSSSIGNYEIRAVGSGGSGSTQNDISDDGFLRLSAGGGSNVNTQSSIDLTGFSTVADMSTNIVMRTEGTERLRITNSGKIGIGTNSPAAALHVASFVNQYVTSYGFLSTGGAGSGTYNQTLPYSIQADGRIRAPEFNAISDARIKKNISKLSTEKQLAELNQLKVVNYSYIDKVVNGDKKKTGFIAQEVEKVNPQLVNQSAEFIPSVFALAKSATIENEILNVTTDQPHGFEKGDLVKLFAEGKKEIIKTIEEVINPKEFLVKGWDAPTENVFVYGKKVYDFRAVDFDQITALSVAAIQELHQQMETLKRENTSLKKTLTNTIQKQQSDIEKRLLQLELKLKEKRK